MACCLAMAMVIGWIRAGWFRLRGRPAPDAPGFAPPAHRPGPAAADLAAARRDPVTAPSVAPSRLPAAIR
jgi:hypothetical protein